MTITRRGLIMLTALLVLTLALSACGKRGPLSLPVTETETMGASHGSL